MESHFVLLQLTTCVLSEKNWNTKEDKSKSMIHALYALLWRKGMSQNEAMSSSARVLSIAEPHLAEGIG